MLGKSRDQGDVLKRRIRLQDIADRLSLSRTTISLALRDHRRISESTKRKVRTLLRQMGYEPDRAARSLNGDSSWSRFNAGGVMNEQPFLQFNYIPEIPPRYECGIDCVGAGLIMNVAHLPAYCKAGLRPDS
jgi:transcriptional regulator with XRE-family HTH domain